MVVQTFSIGSGAKQRLKLFCLPRLFRHFSVMSSCFVPNRCRQLTNKKKKASFEIYSTLPSATVPRIRADGINVIRIYPVITWFSTTEEAFSTHSGLYTHGVDEHGHIACLLYIPGITHWRDLYQVVVLANVCSRNSTGGKRNHRHVSARSGESYISASSRKAVVSITVAINIEAL